MLTDRWNTTSSLKPRFRYELCGTHESQDKEKLKCRQFRSHNACVYIYRCRLHFSDVVFSGHADTCVHAAMRPVLFISRLVTSLPLLALGCASVLRPWIFAPNVKRFSTHFRVCSFSAGCRYSYPCVHAVMHAPLAVCLSFRH